MIDYLICFKKLLIITTFIAFSSDPIYATIIHHNIGTGNLIISGNSTNDYIVTGSTNSHYIEVGLGYHGSITLHNCSFNFSGYGIYSPIRIVGKDGQSNNNPLTIVSLILDGNNSIQNNGGGRACIQVDQGTQINISAIDPCDDNSGTLVARQINDEGGAAIGSLNRSKNTNEPTASALIYDQNGVSIGSYGTTAGGNIVISSGRVTAKGGHGAGIGGGFYSYYDGMVVIYGGVVDASTIRHAAGIGSGCPTGDGVVQEYASNSAVIALPPAIISATGAGSVNFQNIPELGLAGTKVRVYIGDPGMTNCQIRVFTEDHTPDAKIYVDLSQDPDINRVVTATVDPALLDIHQVYFGTTKSNGIYQTTGKLLNNTTFYTDAISVSPDSYGHPYLPKITTLPSGGSVKLQRLMADFTIESYSSSPLILGYSSTDARTNAACVKLVYNDDYPIEDVSFDLANGSNTDFDNLIFLAADSTTVISAPTSLTRGDKLYIIVPIQTNKGAYVFSDVLRIIGVWHGISTSYIRQIVSQVVGYLHTEYICQGDSYWFNGEELTETGLYSSITTTNSLCNSVSSVEFLNLIVNYPVTYEFEDEGCDEYNWNGIIYKETGTYSQNFPISNSCDSIVTLQLTINPIHTTYLNDTTCDSYEWFGKTFYYSGRYTHVLNSIHGCDSILILDLIINNTPEVDIQGYEQVPISSDLWPGIYNYYIADSANFMNCTPTWHCSNQDWIVLPTSSQFHYKIVVNSIGDATLSVTTDCPSGCNSTNSMEIHSFYMNDNEYDEDISIYPNPSYNQVTIIAYFIQRIRIINESGLIIKDISYEDSDGTVLDISDLPQGVFIIEITTHKDKKYKRLSVIKQ